MPTHDSAHLTLEERKVIQVGIENGATKKAIADTVAKDPTTVAKEIRNHRKLKPRNTFNRPVLCGKRACCKKKKPCIAKCSDFEVPVCKRRDKTPGACNKCPSIGKCAMDKYLYDAKAAHEEYRCNLADFREGINLTTLERDRIGTIIAPLLKKGQSLHQVLSAHPEITQSERTMYLYVESGVFKPCGVDCFSLKEQVSRKQFREKYKTRKQPANYAGHTYKDYISFRTENPETLTVEMDTLYNSPSGPYLQTFIFENTAFMFGRLQCEKTSASMAGTLNALQRQLGAELFARLFTLLLTDRGSEFEKIHLFELDEAGDTRLNMFFCDPMQSSQKPHVENNHNYIRDIIPNGCPMEKLTQADVSLMFSHINSTPRRSLGDKTPYELFAFIYGRSTADMLGISEVSRDDVTLKPILIYGKHGR